MTVILFVSLYLSSLLFAVGTRAVPKDNEDNALKPYWNVQSGKSEVRGGCDAHEANLKISWEEACKMSRQALSDVNFMTQNLNDGKGPDAQQQPDDRKRWNRVYPMLLVMFGNPFDDQGKLLTGSREILAHMGIFYDMMQGVCSTKEPFDGSKLLYCDDKFLRWIENGSADPEDPDLKIEEKNPTCGHFGGLWYSDQLPEGLRYRFIEPPKSPESQNQCDGAMAWTHYQHNMVCWCQNGLADTPSIDAVRAKIKGAKTPSPKVAPMMIKTGLITTLDHITGDTSKNDMATTWVHEMGHALSEWEDHPSYDGKGNPKTRKKEVWDQDVQQYVTKEVPGNGYTFKYASRIAQHAPELAIKSPENFALFAKAMYLNEWDWHLGYAQPPPR